MNYFEEISPPSTLARIRAINRDVRRLYLELLDGRTVTVDNPDFDFEIGSVVLIRPEENFIELVPNELWPVESWVGIVRLKLDDITIVDAGSGRWKILETSNEIAYREGNTIEVKDSVGVIRVLSEEPIKYLDLPAVDDTVIDKYKSKEVGSETLAWFNLA